MAIIIETCPKCGHDLVDIMLASNPPIPKKECWNCGWSWTGEREEVVRVPFDDNSIEQEPTYLNLNNVNIDGSAIISVDLCKAELRDMSILDLKQGF